MIQMLISQGNISTEAVIQAFRKVSRGDFIDPPDDGQAEEVRYINMPFRNGVQHLSAPSIYATALEALELGEGMSFLNVCSGTGYLSALVSEIVGKKVCTTPSPRSPPRGPRKAPRHAHCMQPPRMPVRCDASCWTHAASRRACIFY